MDFFTLINNVAKSEGFNQISTVEIQNVLRNNTFYQAFSQFYDAHTELPIMTIVNTNRDTAETYAEAVMTSGRWVSMNEYNLMLVQVLQIMPPDLDYDSAHNFVIINLVRLLTN